MHRKTKCDRHQPCSSCVLRGSPDQCLYEQPTSVSSSGTAATVHRPTVPRVKNRTSKRPSHAAAYTRNSSNHVHRTAAAVDSSGSTPIPTFQRGERLLDNIEAVTTTLGLKSSPATTTAMTVTAATALTSSTDVPDSAFKPGVWPYVLADWIRIGNGNGNGTVSTHEISRCLDLLPTMDQIRRLTDFYLSRVQKLCEP